MVKYSSTREFRSVLYPGVVARLNRMSDARRQQLLRTIAPSKEKEREFARKFRELDTKRVPAFNDDNSPKMNRETGEQIREFTNKEDEQEMMYLLDDLTTFKQTEVYPAYLRWGVASLEGLEIDGEPATVDSLLELGPPELVEEILAAIEGRSEITADAAQNLGLPTTTPAAVEQATQVTNADTAGQPEPSTEETALATSLSS